MRNIVESGEEMRFENEEIHFKTSLTIEGSVVYENCKIFCYEDGCEASIDLEGEGELTFRGCEVVFCGAKGLYDEADEDDDEDDDDDDDEDEDEDEVNYFIHCDGNRGLYIENCKFYNLYRFAFCEALAGLHVSDSEFLNCIEDVFCTNTEFYLDYRIVQDCKFLCRELPDFVKTNAFGALLSAGIPVSNCTFEFAPGMDRHAIEYPSDARHDPTISGCFFVNDHAVPADYLAGNDTTCMHCGFITHENWYRK